MYYCNVCSLLITVLFSVGTTITYGEDVAQLLANANELAIQQQMILDKLTVLIGNIGTNKTLQDVIPGPTRIEVDTSIARNGPIRLYKIKNFLQHSECDYLVKYGEKYFKPSEVMGDRNDKRGEIRTSESAFIERDNQDPQIFKTIKKMHTEAAMPLALGENLQLTRYRNAQKYEFHYDSSMDVGRLVTFLVFLEDIPPDRGGELIFPQARINLKNLEDVERITGIKYPPKNDPSWKNIKLPKLGRQHSDPQPPMAEFCENPHVLKFRPIKGDAIMWFNHDPELMTDFNTLHGGCPPKNPPGKAPVQKVIAQRWMRWWGAGQENEFFGVLRDCGVM